MKTPKDIIIQTKLTLTLPLTLLNRNILCTLFRLTVIFSEFIKGILAGGALAGFVGGANNCTTWQIERCRIWL